MKKNKIILVLSILFGLMMVNSGLNKFFNYMPMPEPSEEMMAVFGALMTIKWLIPLVAIAEIAGGVLFAIPKTRALGAIAIFPVIVGIVVHHLTHDVAGIGIGLFLFLINIWVIFENREKYLPMVKPTV
ncbi:DoxX family protein [Flavobacterium piscis]|uniref:Membrane protein YphA (DoxX/SURF4 family) n=1 Tax=Flavobacterium piscis TaxID=1114874 RepID=A0ABU1YC37_9FLAO|nr:DoxX family protein [Flavobacterium piscis]MDR7210976.1 putative membrane protein YphA (DoxX/SURF4 family) [Flavobacterium piscis]